MPSPNHGDLDSALLQIAEIRAQISRARSFRGYRAATVAATGVFAVISALIQSIVVPSPSTTPGAFVLLWVIAASCALLVTAWELARNYHYLPTPVSAQNTIAAVESFLPCLIAGGIITALLSRNRLDAAWMLPGLWAIFFSQGVFAARKLLPNPIFWVGVWYLLAGAFWLAVPTAEWALSPWSMGGTFGIGQFIAAFVMYYTLERTNDIHDAE